MPHIRHRGVEKELIKIRDYVSEEMGCYRKNQFVAQQIQKVISKVRKEIRKLSCTCMFNLLYYCLQENSFGIGSNVVQAQNDYVCYLENLLTGYCKK